MGRAVRYSVANSRLEASTDFVLALGAFGVDPKDQRATITVPDSLSDNNRADPRRNLVRDIRVPKVLDDQMR